ncbi:MULTISPECIES: RNA ligase [unclassified Moorena]|uniref:RNA ligase n=1 Tax=unclassified Moorena TaxID=2683338 RepID=UPI0013FE9219|nr:MULTISPECIES: RNA ligase [unclassified Moorena]NEO15292.1 2'-5' RNA ligase [Moorena sp. SIO3E8]NEQ01627.1 2'-5' RNA ligase [Moorena sp. SIO3F7]
MLTTRVYEKLDGSLMVLYFYQGEWRVQSSGTAVRVASALPNGIAEIKGFDLTFAELFWKVWHSAGYQFPQKTAYCFMFELMTPYNRIVVRHNREQLILHGARNIQTLQEELPSKWEGKYGWKIVKTYPLTTLPLIIKATEALDPMISEGYIVCDHRFNRLKVKSAKYIEISSAKSGFSTRSILEIILTNEGEEFLTYYPKWLELFNQIKANYDALVREIETSYEQYKDIPLQKDFALAVKHLPYCGTLFALRAQKVSSVREFLCHLPIGKLETLLDLDYVHLG